MLWTYAVNTMTLAMTTDTSNKRKLLQGGGGALVSLHNFIDYNSPAHGTHQYNTEIPRAMIFINVGWHTGLAFQA